MNKDDKKYIKGKIVFSENRLHKSIIATKSDLEKKIQDTKIDLEEKIQDTKIDLEEKIQSTETKLEGKIRNNGVMIEHLEDLILRLAENQDLTNQKLDDLIVRFDNSGIDKFPLIWNNLKNHEKRITKLEAKVV